MSDKGSPWARMIGHGFAHLQNGIDAVCDWGFKKMKETGTKPSGDKDSEMNTYLRTLKNAGKGTLSFFGSLGESYFDKYEKLKKKKKS